MYPYRMKKLNLLFIFLLILIVNVNPSGARELDRLCEEFRSVLSTPPFLLGYRLEDVVDDKGVRRIPNLDIDGDGRLDVVHWACPGQGSPTPADSCTMSIDLFSGRNIAFEEYGFHLILYGGKVYAVAASAGGNRPVGKGRLWRVDGSGVNIVCSNL